MVRVRATASTKAAIIEDLQAGTVVRVLDKTKTRDKFLKDDNFGFYWYESVLPDGKKGWIYGKFLYQMNGDHFTSDASLFINPFRINGKEYYFGIAVEEAYPAGDDTGLTGSDTHAMPFFLEEDKTTALLLKTDKVHTYQDEGQKFPYYFKMTDGEGGTQTVSSITINPKNKTTPVQINFSYDLQDGGGTFSITARQDKGHLIITDFQMKKDTNL